MRGGSAALQARQNASVALGRSRFMMRWVKKRRPNHFPAKSMAARTFFHALNSMKTPPTPVSFRRRFVQNTVAAGLGFNFLPAYLTSARAADNPKLPPSRRINLRM
jgi:hypothetical protein